MKKFKYIIIGVFTLFALTSCLEDFQKINTNEELLGEADPRSAFTDATMNWNNSQRHHLTGKYSGVMRIMQYIVASGGPSEGTYVNQLSPARPNIYTPYYDDYLTRIGQRLQYLVDEVIAKHPEKERFNDLAAISRILQSYEAWLAFDVIGAMPYTEGLSILGGDSEPIWKPRYDLYQSDLNGRPIYKVLDEVIKENIDILYHSNENQYNLGRNDYFYKGDIDKWMRFANTLRIKMAQRVEKADNQFYRSVLEDVLAHPGGIISNNAESAIYHHPIEHNNNTDDMQALTTNYVASRTLINFLKEYNDPRLPILVRRNGFGPGNNNKTNDEFFELLKEHYPNYLTDFAQWTDRYSGPSANPDSSTSLWSRSAYVDIKYVAANGSNKIMQIRCNSQIESRFYVKNGGKVSNTLGIRDKEDQDLYDLPQNSISLFTPLITYPEVCFMMAEIAYKEGGQMGGKDALQWFRDGIRASMEQYQTWAEKMGVPSAMNNKSDNYNPITSAAIDEYLAKPEFNTVTLEKIISQQWVNLFMRPEEAWATWKRTGLPAFSEQPVPYDGVAYFEELKTGGDELLIPRRGVLPTPNQGNIENYHKAVEDLMADPNYGSGVDRTEGRIWWDKP